MASSVLSTVMLLKTQYNSYMMIPIVIAIEIERISGSVGYSQENFRTTEQNTGDELVEVQYDLSAEAASPKILNFS